jgi:hypothetical protein
MDAMPAWHSEPIPPESREALFRQTKSFHALQETMKRRWWAAGWIVGGLGMTIATISTITLMVTLQRWHPTPFFIAVDTSTGWVGEAVGAMDAPKLFSNRVAAQYLRTYVEAREGYLPDRDRAQWETVRAMSSGDEFERIRGLAEVRPGAREAAGYHRQGGYVQLRPILTFAGQQRHAELHRPVPASRSEGAVDRAGEAVARRHRFPVAPRDDDVHAGQSDQPSWNAGHLIQVRAGRLT